MTARHSGGSNHVHTDGHVKWYRPEYLYNGLNGVRGWHGYASGVTGK